MINRLLRTLGSVRFTAAMIAILTALFSLGLLIPQKGLLGRTMYTQWAVEKPELVSALEAMGLTDVYSSPLVLVAWGVFFLNLVVVMSRRAPSTWRRCVSERLPGSVENVRKYKHFRELPGMSLASAASVLSSMGYNVLTEGRAFHAVRNRYAPMGSLLFHLSFFVLLIGAIVSLYTKFSGVAHVGVGETFNNNYISLRPPKLGDVSLVEFRVDDVVPVYFERRTPVSLDVFLTTPKGKSRIGINRPYNQGNTWFVVKDMNVAPMLAVRDPEGNTLDAVAPRLEFLGGEAQSFTLLGTFLSVRFYTDISDLSDTEDLLNRPQMLSQTPEQTEGGRKQRPEVVNPAVRIAAFKDGKKLNEQILLPGSGMDLDGNRIYFEGYDYWVKFSVNGDYGRPVVYAGYALMAFALVFRLVFYRKDVVGVEAAGSLHIGGRCEFYPALFGDELEKIAGRIKKA